MWFDQKEEGRPRRSGCRVVAHGALRSRLRFGRRRLRSRRACLTGTPREASRDPDRAQRGQQRKPAQAGGLKRARRCRAGYPASLRCGRARAPQAASLRAMARAILLADPSLTSTEGSCDDEGAFSASRAARAVVADFRRLCGRVAADTVLATRKLRHFFARTPRSFALQTPAAGRKSETFAPAATSGDGGN
jgi:hypothetical protein